MNDGDSDCTLNKNFICNCYTVTKTDRNKKASKKKKVLKNKFMLQQEICTAKTQDKKTGL